MRIQREPFDAAAEAAKLTRGRTDVGALVTFTGVCRGDEAGEPIAALTLEHYPGMAEAEIERHVAQAAERWPLLGVTVIHRHGRIQPGEDIMMVATASSHRAGGVRRGGISDGLSQDPRPVLETGREGGRENLGGRQDDRRRSGRALERARSAMPRNEG